MIWFAVALSGIACLFDLRSREIPDPLCVITLVLGLTFAALGWLPISWHLSLQGFLVAFLLVIPFALADGLGGGDLKFVAALGTWLGPWGAVSVACWMALSGMVCGIAVAVSGRKSFPYAPAIMLGILVYAVFPQGLEWLVRRLSGGAVST